MKKFVQIDLHMVNILNINQINQKKNQEIMIQKQIKKIPNLKRLNIIMMENQLLESLLEKVYLKNPKKFQKNAIRRLDQLNSQVIQEIGISVKYSLKLVI